MNYKPLPKSLTIKRSKVEGLGLFSTRPIAKGKVLGITHVKDNLFQHGVIRTPLGGFINHSNFPNCELIKGNKVFLLRTLVEIITGEEITLKYELYNPEEE